MNYYQAGDEIISRLTVALPTFKIASLMDVEEVVKSIKNQNLCYVVHSQDRVNEDNKTNNPDYTTVEQNWLIVLAVSTSFQQNTLRKVTTYYPVGEFVSAVFDALQNQRFSEFYTPLKRVNTQYSVINHADKLLIPLQFSTVLTYAV
jgi:hypothetical protein